MAENEDTKEPVDMTPPSKPTGHNSLSLELLSPGPTNFNKYAWLKQTYNAVSPNPANFNEYAWLKQTYNAEK